MAVRNIINQRSVRQRQAQEEFENEYIIEDTSIADLKEQNRKDYIKKAEDTVDINTGDTSLTTIADQLQEQPKRATIDTPAAPKPVVKSTPLTNSTINGMIYEGNLPQVELDANFEEEFKKFSSNPENIKMAGASQSPGWNEKVLKAKGGGWGSKMKKAGAIGLGAVVAGGVIANLMGNGGQQTNAQLYGQQPIY